MRKPKVLANLAIGTLISSFFAVTFIGSADAESLADLAGHTHIHGISFSRAGGEESVILATHHGMYALDGKGNATPISITQDFMGFSADPSDPLRYLGSGHPAEGGNLGVIESRDGGSTWQKIADGVGGPVDFHAMTVSKADPKVFYGTFRGIQMSNDGGTTWSMTGPVPEKIIALAGSASDPKTIYAATATGLQVSTDSGESWKAGGFDGQVVSAVFVSPDKAVLVFVVGQGLMKASEDRLPEWNPLATDFGDSVPLHIAMSNKDPSHMVMATYTNELLESSDAGRTWRPYGQSTP